MSTCWYCCELKNFKHDIKLISIIIKTCLCHFTTSFQTFYLSLIILEDLNGKLFCKMICPMSHVQHYYILFEFYNKFSYLFNKSLGKVQKSKSLSTREHSMTKKFKFLKFSSYLSINRTNERMNEILSIRINPNAIITIFLFISCVHQSIYPGRMFETPIQ